MDAEIRLGERGTGQEELLISDAGTADAELQFGGGEEPCGCGGGESWVSLSKADVEKILAAMNGEPGALEAIAVPTREYDVYRVRLGRRRTRTRGAVLGLGLTTD